MSARRVASVAWRSRQGGQMSTIQEKPGGSDSCTHHHHTRHRPSLRPAKSGRSKAVLRYTEHGIPHIVAKDYAGLGYGYGCAAATDNVCELANIYLTVSGQRSQVLRPGGRRLPVAVRGGEQPAQRPVLQADQRLRDRSTGWSRNRRRWGRAAKSARSFPATSGVQRLPRAHRPRRHLRPGLPRRRLGPADHRAGLLPALLRDRDHRRPGRRHRRPVHGAAVRRDARPGHRRAAFGEEWRRRSTAAGSAATASRSAGRHRGRPGSVLLGNPHYPWQGGRRFWQAS